MNKLNDLLEHLDVVKMQKAILESKINTEIRIIQEADKDTKIPDDIIDLIIDFKAEKAPF